MSILRLDGVRREIGDFVILDSVTAALARGERVGLVGGNGAGKTTLLEIVTGREEADGGTGPHGQGLAPGPADPGGQPRPPLHRGTHRARHRARRCGRGRAHGAGAGRAGGARRRGRTERRLRHPARALRGRPTAITSTSVCRSRWPAWASRAATGTTSPASSRAASRPAWRWPGCWWRTRIC